MKSSELWAEEVTNRRAANEQKWLGKRSEGPEMAAKWVNFAFSSFTYYPHAICHQHAPTTTQSSVSPVQARDHASTSGLGQSRRERGRQPDSSSLPDLPDSRVN